MQRIINFIFMIQEGGIQRGLAPLAPNQNEILVLGARPKKICGTKFLWAFKKWLHI